MNLKPPISMDVRESVLEAVREGMPPAEVARAYGVGLSSVYRWMRKSRRPPRPVMSSAPPGNRLRELERALASAEARIARLQESLFHSYEPEVKRALLDLFIEGQVPVEQVTRATGIPEANLNQWRRTVSTRPPPGN